ncbi:MAG: hypothetical protein KDJ98_05665, partial [Rhodobacteraceae bacterium]|nr:hypothetical protein [Paracoccaceae bacterium]
VPFELIAEIGFAHDGLLASKLGKKASTNLGAIHPSSPSMVSTMPCAPTMPVYQTPISDLRKCGRGLAVRSTGSDIASTIQWPVAFAI